MLLESEGLRADTLRRFAPPDGPLRCTPPTLRPLLAILASSSEATLSNAPPIARPACEIPGPSLVVNTTMLRGIPDPKCAY